MFGAIQNLAFFKIGWLACILLAAAGKPALATLAVAVVVVLHLARAPVPVKEALLLAIAGLIGLGWESLVVFSGLIEYPAISSAYPLAPFWIVAMWVLFATTINHGLKWIKRHWAIAALAGAVGGPMAFYGGAAMGAAQFSEPALALAVIGAGWAVLLPLLAIISDTIIDSEWLEPGPTFDRKRPNIVPARPASELLAHIGGTRQHV